MTALRFSRRGVMVAAVAGGVAACSGGEGSGPGAASGPTSPGVPSATSTAGSPAVTGPNQADWTRLRRSVRGRLALPSDPAYDTVRLLQNPRYDAARPLAVLSVRVPGDVVAGLAFARDHGVPVAIRSGGHSYPGWSGGGSPPALVIDVRPLNQVRLRGSTATVGAGATLVDVYDAVGSRGRALAGGSCPTVGIAGLTLGGGVGVLTRAMGLTCDAVTSMQVVTADGRVLSASADEEPDLFWALRGGGGGHLGVVTSFQFETAPAPTLQTVYLQWPVSAAPDVIAAWQSWAPGAPAELWSTLKVLGGRKHGAGPVLLVSATWTGSPSAFDRQLAGLLAEVPQPATSVRNSRGYLEAMLAYAGCASIPVESCTTAPGGSLSREAFGATSSVAYEPLRPSGVTDLLSQVDLAQSSGLLEAGVSLDALGGRVADIDAADTAFVHRSALATVQYTATFPPGSARAADRYVRSFRRAMVPHWGRHAYVNYADPTIDDYMDAYFGSNATRLSQTRGSYDPDGFFTQPQDY